MIGKLLFHFIRFKESTKLLLSFCLLLILSACNEDEKILQELKEINRRHQHQYATELYLKKEQDQLNQAVTIQEKKEIWEYIQRERKKERKQDIERYKKEILECLKNVKQINDKNITGKTFTNIRAYALQRVENESFFKNALRFILLLVTSDKHDSDIHLFQWNIDQIISLQALIWELEWFPFYVESSLEDSIKKAAPSIDAYKEVNDHVINKLTERYLFEIRI